MENQVTITPLSAHLKDFRQEEKSGHIDTLLEVFAHLENAKDKESTVQLRRNLRSAMQYFSKKQLFFFVKREFNTGIERTNYDRDFEYRGSRIFRAG